MEVELLNQRRGEKNSIQLFQKKLNAKKPRFSSSRGGGDAVWGGEDRGLEQRVEKGSVGLPGSK